MFREQLLVWFNEERPDPGLIESAVENVDANVEALDFDEEAALAGVKAVNEKIQLKLDQVEASFGELPGLSKKIEGLLSEWQVKQEQFVEKIGEVDAIKMNPEVWHYLVNGDHNIYGDNGFAQLTVGLDELVVNIQNELEGELNEVETEMTVLLNNIDLAVKNVRVRSITVARQALEKQMAGIDITTEEAELPILKENNNIVAASSRAESLGYIKRIYEVNGETKIDVGAGAIKHSYEGTYTLSELAKLVKEHGDVFVETIDKNAKEVSTGADSAFARLNKLNEQIGELNLQERLLKNPEFAKDYVVVTALQARQKELFDQFGQTLQAYQSWQIEHGGISSVSRLMAVVAGIPVAEATDRINNLGANFSADNLMDVFSLTRVDQMYKMFAKADWSAVTNPEFVDESPMKGKLRLLAKQMGSVKMALNNVLLGEPLPVNQNDDDVVYEMSLLRASKNSEYTAKNSVDAKLSYIKHLSATEPESEAGLGESLELYHKALDEYMNYDVNGESIYMLTSGEVSMTKAINLLVASGQIDNDHKFVFGAKDMKNIRAKLADKWPLVVDTWKRLNGRGAEVASPNTDAKKAAEAAYKFDIDFKAETSRLANVEKDDQMKYLKGQLMANDVTSIVAKANDKINNVNIGKEILDIVDDPSTYILLAITAATEGIGAAGSAGRVGIRLRKILGFARPTSNLTRFVASTLVDSAIVHTGMNISYELLGREQMANWGVDGYASMAANFGVGKLAPTLLKGRFEKLAKTSPRLASYVELGVVTGLDTGASIGLAVIEDYLRSGNTDRAYEAMIKSVQFLAVNQFLHFGKVGRLQKAEKGLMDLEAKIGGIPSEAQARQYFKLYNDYVHELNRQQFSDYMKGLSGKAKATMSPKDVIVGDQAYEGFVKEAKVRLKTAYDGGDINQTKYERNIKLMDGVENKDGFFDPATGLVVVRNGKNSERVSSVLEHERAHRIFNSLPDSEVRRTLIEDIVNAKNLAPGVNIAVVKETIAKYKRLGWSDLDISDELFQLHKHYSEVRDDYVDSAYQVNVDELGLRGDKGMAANGGEMQKVRVAELPADVNEIVASLKGSFPEHMTAQQVLDQINFYAGTMSLLPSDNAKRAFANGIATRNHKQLIELLEKRWGSLNPNLDANFDMRYDAKVRAQKVVINGLKLERGRAMSVLEGLRRKNFFDDDLTPAKINDLTKVLIDSAGLEKLSFYKWFAKDERRGQLEDLYKLYKTSRLVSK